jgi:hypothetical protein
LETSQPWLVHITPALEAAVEVVPDAAVVDAMDQQEQILVQQVALRGQAVVLVAVVVAVASVAFLMALQDWLPLSW